MPISSFLAPSAIARPGVCTSSTRPASPYQGQVIYQTDTNTTLVWNGSGWVLLSTGTANPPGLELIKSTTVGSAVSSVSITNVFSSSFDSYRIVGANIDGSTTDQYLQLTFGSTNTGYYGSFYWDSFSGSNTGQVRVNAGAYLNVARMVIDDDISFSFDCNGPFKTTRTNNHGTFNCGGLTGWFGGMLANQTSYTDMTITTSSGTITGGTIRVYGYRNS